MTAPLDPRERALDDAARALPREIAPPPELLGRVQGAIAARRERTLTTRATAPAAVTSTGPSRRAIAAAALFVAGLCIGALAMALRPGQPVAAVATTPAAAPGLARYAAYERAAGDLATLAAASEGTLAPATRAVIARSLARMDSALADVRAAVARDPGNAALGAVLRDLYEQKLDVLRRTAALSRS